MIKASFLKHIIYIVMKSHLSEFNGFCYWAMPFFPHFQMQTATKGQAFNMKRDR